MVLPDIVEEALRGGMQDVAERVREGVVAAAARPVTLRANALKATVAEVAEELDRAGIAHEGVPFYEDALIVEGARERALWELPAYREGRIYLQSLSSMLPPLALAPVPGADILDMCAAPGGKTSQLAALTRGRAHITACELHAPRAEKLAFNLEKLGVRGVNVMRVDARRLDDFFSFDQILVDAPCTGSGTLRAGDERAAARITPQLLKKTTRSQQALLDRALTILKPGGTLVYSTCSILPQENEGQVRRALARHRDCRIIPLDGTPLPDSVPALAPTAAAVAQAAGTGVLPVLGNDLSGTLTICPTRLFEGFYLALIRKG